MLLLNIENMLFFFFKLRFLSDIISNVSIELSHPEKNLLCNRQSLRGAKASYGEENQPCVAWVLAILFACSNDRG